MTECIEWAGAGGKGGYGRRRDGDRLVAAHRFAWEEANGPIPGGLFVLHRCDNPPCINVDHLFLGTQADNIADMIAKGRHVSPHGEASPHARLSQAQVDKIRALSADGMSRRNVARQFGISHQHVTSIVLGQCWSRSRT